MPVPLWTWSKEESPSQGKCGVLFLETWSTSSRPSLSGTDPEPFRLGWWLGGGGYGGGDGDGVAMELDFLSSPPFPHALFLSRVSGGCRQFDFSLRDLDVVHGSSGARAGGIWGRFGALGCGPLVHGATRSDGRWRNSRARRGSPPHSTPELSALQAPGGAIRKYWVCGGVKSELNLKGLSALPRKVGADGIF